MEISGLAGELERAKTAVQRYASLKPTVGLVLGSGLGAFADTFEDRHAIAYASVPGIPPSRVVGHAGNLVLGRVGRTTVVAMQGRAHLYEGHSAEEVVFGTRLMVKLGATTVLITNAAGGIDPSFRPGDLMLIEDHLNLTGQNCLVGPNDDALGPRFPDMTVAYDRDLLERADAEARALGLTLRRGAYAGMLGPTYETPAEVRMLRTLGASAVGMSTVLEVIAARHLGARVVGISCITNVAAGLGAAHDGGHATLSHDEVKETAERVRADFIALLRAIVDSPGAAPA
jgi:purine-nucleoside phosphorylase